MLESDLNSTISVVQEKTKGLPELRKRLSGQNLVAFTSDLSLVAYSVRTGYLVDVLSPQEPVDLFTRLLSDLRADPRAKDYFVSVFHLYEPSSDQSFFVNTTLLAQRIKDYQKADDSSLDLGNADLRSTFVHLKPTIEIIEPPVQIVRLLTSILPLTSVANIPLSHSLPDGTPVENAVALAAILLDYPVAYVPSASHQGVLSGIPLDFYECFLAFHEGNRKDEQGHREIIRSLMKFSCPAELAHTRSAEYPGLQPQIMIQRLRDMLQKRIGESSSMRIAAVEHSIHTLDHVAF